MDQQLEAPETGAVTIQPDIRNQLIDEYLAYLQFERGLADNTVSSYRRDLAQFQAFIDGHGMNAIDVTTASIRDFLAGLKQ